MDSQLLPRKSSTNCYYNSKHQYVCSKSAFSKYGKYIVIAVIIVIVIILLLAALFILRRRRASRAKLANEGTAALPPPAQQGYSAGQNENALPPMPMEHDKPAASLAPQQQSGYGAPPAGPPPPNQYGAPPSGPPPQNQYPQGAAASYYNS